MLREREVALKLCSGRWYQGVRPSLQLERAATTGRTGIRSRGPGNLFADFYNKICQEGTHAAQQTTQLVASLFDHLIGAGEQCGWHGEAERLCGLEIDDQLDFRGLLDRQVGCLLPLENPAGVDADLTVCVRATASVANQATSCGELAIHVDRGHRVADRKCGELSSANSEISINPDHECTGMELDQGFKDRIEVALGARVQDMKLQPERAGCRLQVPRLSLGITGIGRVDEQGNDGRRRDQFMQQL